MDQSLQNLYDRTGDMAQVRHRVLRNTYWLLALSMIPTVVGAVIGIASGLTLPGGFVGFFLFLGVVMGGQYVVRKFKDTAAGIVALLGFTFVMGLFMTPLLTRTLGFSNGGTLIMLAFSGTASVFAVLATIATVTKRDFSPMGKWLSLGCLILVLAAFANLFLGLPALWIAFSVLSIAIFSAYILYDVQQIINGGETNYIVATSNIYLDVFFIFNNLLSLLGLGGSRD